MTLNLPASAGLQGRVVYVRQDALAGASIPKVLQGLTITGTAQYTTVGGNLSEVGVYVRASWPSNCQTITTNIVACDPSAESAQAIGRITLQAGTGQPFTLSGPALDEAGKAGHGYFGVRAIQGNSLTGDQLSLKELQARARL